MPIVNLLSTNDKFIPYRAQLSSFGAEAEGKVVKKASVTLQGNSGSGWTTLASDTYYVRRRTGYLEKRVSDNDGDDIDWNAYIDYQDAGNQAFRVTYTVKNGATETTYTTESATFAEADYYNIAGEDGGLDAELAQNLFVDEIHANIGDIANWIIADSQISSDSGSAVINSSTPYIGLGTTTYNSGTGFWAGKNSGAYKLFVGNSAGDKMLWTSTALEITGDLTTDNIIATGGTIGGWTLSSTALTGGNATLHSTGYLLLGTSNDIARMDATDATYRFWVGNATAASAPFRVTKAGALTATSATITGTITATAGAIGGFDIGADYLRDAANTFGLASTVTGGDDIRFWAGDSFTNRATAPLQIYESGYIFAKDIVLAKGNLSGASGVTGYGYAVGDPLLLCHYDGAKPYESDYRGSAITHKGIAETRAGGVIFRPGKFNKALQIAEATTNLVLNPSAETTGNFTARGTATIARPTTFTYFGGNAYGVTLAATNDGIDLTLSALANAVHYVSFWTAGSNSTNWQVSLDGSNWNTPTLVETDTISTSTTWRRYAVSILAAQANGSTTLRLRNTGSSGAPFLDGIQVEQKTYYTPYCDGSLGDGHSWSGTAHASTSARVAATLTYPASGAINLNQGTLSCWVFIPAVQKSFPSLFGARIDANNFIVINIAASGALTPYAQSSSAGSSVDTSSGATTVSAGWNHIAVTWVAGALKFYVNGVQSGATAVYVVPSGTLSTIEIGAFNSSGQANTRVDDICILASVLALNEIKSIYYSEAPLMLGISNQEIRLSEASGGDVFGSGKGLFGRAADGTPSFALLNATYNATNWGGDSESFDSGDFLFGSNKSGKSNLWWDASAGSLFFRVQTTKRIALETDGDILVGTDITAAASTTIAIFGANQTYNSESVETGDILIGDSSASKGNIFWDKSAGGLYFRTAKTKKVSIESDGDMFIGTDVSAADTTSLGIFNNSQTYNSEAGFAAGDVLIGSNSSGKANIFYDSSAGTLYFRAATVNLVAISSAGIQTNRAFGHSQTSVDLAGTNIELDDGLGRIDTSYLRIASGTGNFNLRTIKTPDTAIEGQRLIVHNNTSYDMTIVDNYGSPSAGYGKIRTLTGGNITSAGDCVVEFVYNDNNDRWDLLNLGAGTWT